MPAAAGTFNALQTSLTTGGTAQRVATVAQLNALGNPDVSGVIIKAAKANTAPIAIGASTVTAANGYLMDPGDVLAIDNCVGLGNLWFNGSAAGSVVSILLKG